MTDETTGVAGTPLRPSWSVEKASQELAHLPVTEACVSGLCDICLAQQGSLCDVVGTPWKDSPSSKRSDH